jgi:4'-phosphopantetheinyl transferase EntD
VDPERAFRSLLPDGVAVVAAPSEAEPRPLYAEEAAQAARMAARRRHEFALGRSCARRALAALDVAPVALPMAADRSPVWPAGVVGSISHWDGWCVAAAAPTAACRALGIDGERRRALPAGVGPLVTTKSERAWLSDTDAGSHWETALFTMKEATYKAWAPLTGLWLDFEDVELTVDVASGVFRADLRVPDVPSSVGASLEGRFAIDEDAVLAAVVVPR